MAEPQTARFPAPDTRRGSCEESTSKRAATAPVATLP